MTEPTDGERLADMETEMDRLKAAEELALEPEIDEDDGDPTLPDYDDGEDYPNG